RGSLFTPDAYKALSEAFHTLATRGRRRGLVPMLFCQKISEIAKIVLTPGTYFLLKQSVTVDQKRYLEILEKTDTLAFMSEKQIMQYIGSLPPGKAIVRLPNSEQRIVQLFERSSQHISRTPKVSSAMSRYSALSFSPDMRFGADIEVEPVVPATMQPSAKKLSIVKAAKEGNTEYPCEKCNAPSTHQFLSSTLRATAKGTFTEEKYKYFCSIHANKRCKPL